MFSQRFLERCAHVLIGASFFVPLVLMPNNFIFPFIVPKIVAFRTIVCVLSALYLLLLLTHWKMYEPKRTWISLSVGAFLLSFTISTFVGVDWYHSFWDNHERMLGLFTVLHYGVLYVVATSVVREERHWDTLCKWFLFSGLLVVLLAGIQKISPNFLLNQGNGRVSSTLGNAIYLGGYGMFMCFCGLLVWARAHTPLWKYLGLSAIPVGIAGIVSSGTRGSFLGLLAGGAVIGICYVIHAWDQKRVRTISYGVFISCSVLVGLLFSFRHTPFVQRLPIVGSLVNLSLSSGTAGTRLLAWHIAIEGWKERPFFGWGPNNFFYIFNAHYNPSSLRYGWGETWFDNAHNILLNTLAVQGAFGLLTYVALFIVVTLVIYRGYKKGLLSLPVAAITAGFFVAHFIHNVFVFENPTSYIYFFFMLALVNAVSQPTDIVVEKFSGRVAGTPVIVIGVCFAFIIYVTNVNPARANTATLRAIQKVYNGQQPLAAFDDVTAIPSPHIDDIRSDFARAVTESAKNYADAGRSEDGAALVDRAYKELQKNRVLHPLDIRIQLEQANLAQVAISYLHKSDYMADAAQALQDALRKSPHRQQIIYQLVAFELAFNRNNEAITLLQNSITDDPVVGEGWWRLVLLYQQLGQPTKARETAQAALAKNANLDEQGMRVIQSALATSTLGGIQK